MSRILIIPTITGSENSFFRSSFALLLWAAICFPLSDCEEVFLWFDKIIRNRIICSIVLFRIIVKV